MACILVCGGAALPSDRIAFVRILFSSPFISGYPYDVREIIGLSLGSPVDDGSSLRFAI